MKRYRKNFVLFCVVLALLLTACSTGGRQRITPDELDPALNQEIDPDKDPDLCPDLSHKRQL